MSLKGKFIQESLKLFSLKGFESTSIHDILSAVKASRGGFYCHFASKEDLFHEVLKEARGIWRERNLAGLDQIEESTRKLKKLLENYCDRYLLDSDNFPGGCIFVKFAVELGDLRPHLSQEVHKGFIGLKKMIKRLLTEGQAAGEFSGEIDLDMATEILFNGMLGASINYNADKSVATLKRSVKALIDYLEKLRS
jgi:TetR/AcrR family transcriptional regulator, transcriptional repressor for nem operon